MPRIPYTGVPDREPTSIPIESGATPQAFGVNVGQAISRLGETGNQVGNELFARAVALQDLNEDSKAYSQGETVLRQNDELMNAFKQTQGDDPQKHLIEHQNQLQANVEAGRKGLSPYALNKYNQITLRRLGYDISTSSSYAASEMKKYSAVTQLSLADEMTKNLIANIDNPDAANHNLDQQAALEANIVGGEGFHDPTSPYVKSRIETRMAKSLDTATEYIINNRNPEDAIKFLDANADRIGGKNSPNYLALHDKILQRSVDVLAARDARTITGDSSSFIDQRRISPKIDTAHLDPEFKSRLGMAIQAAEQATGDKASIISARRTTAEQANLFRQYEQGLIGLAAPPGSSLHEVGKAVDLNGGAVLKKLHEWQASGELQSKYGVTFLTGRAGEVDPGHLQMANNEPSIKAQQKQLDVSKALNQANEMVQNQAENGMLSGSRYLENYNEALMRHIRSNASILSQQNEQQVKTAKTAISKVWSDNVVFDQSGNATINPNFYNDIMTAERQYPGLVTGEARTMIDWAQHQQLAKNKAVITDPAVKQKLFDGMFTSVNPTTRIDILKETTLNHISGADSTHLLALHNELEKEPIKDPVFRSALDAVKARLITSISGIKDDVGMADYTNFLGAFVPEYMQQRRTGKLQPNALNLNDPKSLISQAIQSTRSPLSKTIPSNGGVTVPPPPTPAEPVLTTVPPLNDRVKDRVYNFPSGKMQWTGTGWMPVQVAPLNPNQL